MKTISSRQPVSRPGPRLPLRAIAGLLALVAVTCGGARAAETTTGPQGLKLMYPESLRGKQVDDYHGTKVADPYRWLEEPDSAETKTWVTAQNRVTISYLEGISRRPAIRERLTKLWNYERFNIPLQRGGRYFYQRNDGLQNQAVLYVVESLGAPPQELLDPNKLSNDGTVALANWHVSDDGRFLAYGLAAAGSDWREWHVRDVATGRDLVDHLKWIKFSGVAWTPEGGGFYYSRYDAPKPEETFTGTNYFQKLFYHRLGDPQSADRLVYERPDQKEWGFGGDVTEDGRYLVIQVWRGTERKNQVFYRDLQSPAAKVVELLAGFDAEYHLLGNDGPVFWFHTDWEAPLKRVIAVDVTRPERANWRIIIPEAADNLESVGLVGDRFFASYLHNAASFVKVFDLTGKHERDVQLPALGSVAGFGGRRDDHETFYSFTSYTSPSTIYRYDVTAGQSTIFRRPEVAFDPDEFETRQVSYTSRDGTRVPMMITHRRGLKLDGSNPTILYGYGGFNISQTPGFSVSNLVWLEMGGVYAVANLRGGGEFGRTWHEAGMQDKKQNVFDDFIAAAQWLTANQYTSPQKLAIRGGSNGGLLVGAAITQRPDLFAAALPAVGVMDMLRYHKFTIGWAWVSEYGSSDDPLAFATLAGYSPLHNLKPGVNYPATLVTTADHDDRVVPGHSFKFAAALQAAQAGTAPVLIRIETRAGHGAGTPTTKQIDAATDSLAFLTAVLKIE